MEADRYTIGTEPLHPGATCVVLHVLDSAPGASLAPILTLLTTAPDRDGLEAIAILEGRHQNPQDMEAEQVRV